MTQNRLSKVWVHLRTPLLLIALGAILIIYVVNNPGGAIAARALTYPNVLRYLREHVVLVIAAMVLAVLVGIPVGIMLTRPKLRRIGKVIETFVNIGQTVPSLAILALFFVYLGLGFNTALFALWLYSILPILRNTYAGITSIEPEILEAARGMGMTPWRTLYKIELPLALPVLMAGVRTSTVICVGTATLATFIGGGALGDLIKTGIQVRRDILVFTGAGLSALLAILLDYLAGQAEIAILNKRN
ncbi:ABC transporter permease [Dethiobacter alkaliphilus]|uniref:Binding-protein-dependent transport systems inner membrane component n=1 Tax=Dethiobacter alkaliphilus AHT 1 TaxID=555088 RepID=C0GK34_DETAL|nr:ABC transporter permease [Dethiobacter alkaliphilus]EEG76304.1 binding-protein-dependent transport systems inner membrane component [Dethiobacter alkaliphilus AHT 1]